MNNRHLYLFFLSAPKVQLTVNSRIGKGRNTNSWQSARKLKILYALDYNDCGPKCQFSSKQSPLQPRPSNAEPSSKPSHSVGLRYFSHPNSHLISRDRWRLIQGWGRTFQPFGTAVISNRTPRIYSTC